MLYTTVVTYAIQFACLMWRKYKGYGTSIDAEHKQNSGVPCGPLDRCK